MTACLAALLVDTFSGRRIELFDPRTGAARGGLDVPPTTVPPLTTAGRYVVFATGRTIRALDIGSMRISVIATAAAAPIGLSVDGTRVAWAENLRSRGRVRAVALG